MLYLAKFLAPAVVAAFATWWVTDELWRGWMADERLVYAEAKAEAVEKARKDQKAIDDEALRAAVAEAEAREVIIERTNTITEEIPYYVTDTSNCITLGLVRVLDGAARGDLPSSLPLSPGQFNETCADVRASDLARNVADNYGRFHLTAARLTGLQSYVRGVAATINERNSP